jgi:hypothetical protein
VLGHSEGFPSLLVAAIKMGFLGKSGFYPVMALQSADARLNTDLALIARESIPNIAFVKVNIVAFQKHTILP